MKRDFNSLTLRISEKIYGQLLRAYPPAHRAEYGPAMRQLFRDQGRDAWNEAGQWGLMKLWLRVLPDLVRTVLAEQIAGFNPVKSMSHRLAGWFRSTSPWPAFFTAAAVVFLLTLGLSVISTFLLPKMYASTVRLKVTPQLVWPVDPLAVAPGAHSIFFGTDYLPRLEPALPPVPSVGPVIRPASQIVESDVVLTRVVKQLNLAVKWGQKYYGGRVLTGPEAIAILRQRMFLVPVRNTSLIGVTLYDEDKNEAAQIANAVAESSRDNCAAIAKGMPVKGYASLRMEITDSAEPGRAPVRPNQPLNIVIGALTGGVLGLLAGTVMALIWRIARVTMKAELV